MLIEVTPFIESVDLTLPRLTTGTMYTDRLFLDIFPPHIYFATGKRGNYDFFVV